MYATFISKVDSVCCCPDVGLWIELWLVTEYHPAGSLFDRLSRSPVSLDAMMRMSLSIVSGLEHLHVDIRGTQGMPALATGVRIADIS